MAATSCLSSCVLLSLHSCPYVHIFTWTRSLVHMPASVMSTVRCRSEVTKLMCDNIPSSNPSCDTAGALCSRSTWVLRPPASARTHSELLLSPVSWPSCYLALIIPCKRPADHRAIDHVHSFSNSILRLVVSGCFLHDRLIYHFDFCISWTTNGPLIRMRRTACYKFLFEVLNNIAVLHNIETIWRFHVLLIDLNTAVTDSLRVTHSTAYWILYGTLYWLKLCRYYSKQVYNTELFACTPRRAKLVVLRLNNMLTPSLFMRMTFELFTLLRGTCLCVPY